LSNPPFAIVLTLPGWRESVGVQAEIAIARELGKPVTFLQPVAAASLATTGARKGTWSA
jgi:hypothetical protein